MVRIALLGCGRIGKMHADNISACESTTLVGVYDIHTPFAQDVADRNNAKIYSNANEAFTASDVDAVLIATPTATHVDFIESAVNSGKAVLCEKPIDLSLERVNELKTRIGGTDVPIMLGFVRRFDPGHAAARQSVLDGEIGDLHQVIITSRDPAMAPDAYIETSGGIFRDMTIHDLDLARFMLDEEISTVSAAGSRLVDPALMQRCNDYDTIVVTLETATGRQAIITNSRQAVYGYDQRVELFGSKGMVISGNRLENPVTKYHADATGISSPLQYFFIERYTEAFNAEIAHFADIVANGAAVSVGFEDGRMALLLAEACIRSARESRVVSLDEFG